jgi:hypothetical protein
MYVNRTTCKYPCERNSFVHVVPISRYVCSSTLRLTIGNVSLIQFNNDRCLRVIYSTKTSSTAVRRVIYAIVRCHANDQCALIRACSHSLSLSLSARVSHVDKNPLTSTLTLHDARLLPPSQTSDRRSTRALFNVDH